MKRPAFQFYPADWRKDAALQSCSIGARGLWVEMMCIMHECTPYGYLCVNGQPMTDNQLARLVGDTVKAVVSYKKELEAAGVYSFDEGRIYSRRMVKDEHLRNIRAQAGSMGGNPALLSGKDKQKVKQIDNHTPKQSPTPSSSSSSSPSGLKADARATRLPADWILPNAWSEWAEKEKGWSSEKAKQVSASFKDYWIAKAGKDGRKLDWYATWRNWVRNQRDQVATKPIVIKPWFIDGWAAIAAKGDEFNLKESDFDHPQTFRAAVLKAAGITPEMVKQAEAMAK